MTRTSFVSLVFCLIALPITGMAGGLDTPSTVEFAPARATDAFTPHKLPADARVSTPPTDIVEQIRSGNGDVEVVVPTANGPWRLTGERFEVLSAGADVLARDAYGEHVMPTPKHAFVRGTVEGAPNSRFFLAAFETHVSAIIEFEEPEGYHIPLGAKGAAWISATKPRGL